MGRRERSRNHRRWISWRLSGELLMRFYSTLGSSRRTDSGDSSCASAWAGVGRKMRPAARAVIGIAALYNQLVKTQKDGRAHIQAI